jgi:AcrR family transcriptional regulator
LGRRLGTVDNDRVKEPLTRDRICEVALEAIDESGIESISMRMLAGSLGVKASSLYYHFDSKDELMMGVAEFLYRELGRPPSDGDWAERLKGTFIQLQDFVQMHPNAAPLLVRGLADSPIAKKRADALLRTICRGGLDPASSASLISNLVALLVGHSLLAVWVERETEVIGGDGSGNGRDARGGRAWIYRLFQPEAPESDGLDRAVPASSVDLPGDGVFLAGLEALIRGFTAD